MYVGLLSNFDYFPIAFVHYLHFASCIFCFTEVFCLGHTRLCFESGPLCFGFDCFVFNLNWKFIMFENRLRRLLVPRFTKTSNKWCAIGRSFISNELIIWENISSLIQTTHSYNWHSSEEKKLNCSWVCGNTVFGKTILTLIILQK